jgi:hypothetical protein
MKRFSDLEKWVNLAYDYETELLDKMGLSKHMINYVSFTEWTAVFMVTDWNNSSESKDVFHTLSLREFLKVVGEYNE